ncbi:MAG: hypothetical protein MUF00_15270 [Gemmatimonadaceae bacterium]|nr:hypothetical protein [Gemmatimonadaceae bacterium]
MTLRTPLAFGMLFSALAIAAQLAASAPSATPAPPLLAFPDPALDDPAAYPGYRARLHRDIAGNTLQVYLSSRDRRVVHVWADADNESLAFTVRTLAGDTVPLRFGETTATTRRRGRWRVFEYPLVIGAPDAEIAHLLLGSMRVERDVQYWGRHKEPASAAPFVLAEYDSLRRTLERLPAGTARRHLALLRASSIEGLAARFLPTLQLRTTGARTVVETVQSSVDARDSLRLELVVDPRAIAVEQAGRSVRLRARTGNTLMLTVRVATTGAALTPLSREQIFTREFLAYMRAESTSVASQPAASPAALRVRRLERQVRGVELLSSREKLMAGLPTYATYFGRDMLVSALMMQPIWRPEMAEFVIGAALGKLGPDGGVSHEEALGEQASREAITDYVATMRAARTATGTRADSLLARAEQLLRTHRRTRENYHMVDDEFQLPIMVGRWLTDARATREAQRRFLLARGASGQSHMHELVQELALVARMAAPYAADPRAERLVSFGRRDTLWASESWRDSGAGYGNGRFAMDVNAIWVPNALAALVDITRALPRLGISVDSLVHAHPALRGDAPLSVWLRDSLALARAVTTWRGATRHFVVRRSAADIWAAVGARLATLPADELAWWTQQLAQHAAREEPLEFLALALDSTGTPIPVINSDPATRLFLETAAADSAAVMRDVRPFADGYPRGLLIDNVGPMVTNDIFAAPAVWREFDRDPYHGPRVAWGREVNLFVLGAAKQYAALPPARAQYRATLRAAIDAVVHAVEASGFHAELWSREMRDGRQRAARYGTGNDLQLWSTTDLVVQYTLSTLR